MDIVIIINSTIVGIGIGLIAMDWRDRRKVLADLQAERVRVTDALKTVVDTVNPLVVQVQQLRDKANATEMRLAQTNRSPTGGRG